MFRVEGNLRSETFDDARAAAEFGALVDRLGGAAAIAIRDARSGAAAGGRPVITLEAWFEHHLQHATSITPGTVAEYRRVATRSWLPTLGPLPLEAILRDDVARWIGEQAKAVTKRGTPTSSKTIANQHGLLSAVMASAVDAGHIGSNPCRGLGIPRTERGEMVFLTQAEYSILVSKIDPKWQPLVNLLGDRAALGRGNRPALGRPRPRRRRPRRPSRARMEARRHVQGPRHTEDQALAAHRVPARSGRRRAAAARRPRRPAGVPLTAWRHGPLGELP